MNNINIQNLRFMYFSLLLLVVIMLIKRFIIDFCLIFSFSILDSNNMQTYISRHIANRTTRISSPFTLRTPTLDVTPMHFQHQCLHIYHNHTHKTTIKNNHKTKHNFYETSCTLFGYEMNKTHKIPRLSATPKHNKEGSSG